MPYAYVLQILHSAKVAVSKFEAEKLPNLQKEDLKLGRNLTSLVQAANTLLGKLIVVEFATDLILSTCTTFYSTSLIDALTKDMSSTARAAGITRGGGFILLTCHNVLRMWFLFKVGQEYSANYAVSNLIKNPRKPKNIPSSKAIKQHLQDAKVNKRTIWD